VHLSTTGLHVWSAAQRQQADAEDAATKRHPASRILMAGLTPTDLRPRTTRVRDRPEWALKTAEFLASLDESSDICFIQHHSLEQALGRRSRLPYFRGAVKVLIQYMTDRLFHPIG
jgi:hypothetical protein